MRSTARWHYVERVAGSRISQRQGIKSAHLHQHFLFPLISPRSKCHTRAGQAAPAEGGGVAAWAKDPEAACAACSASLVCLAASHTARKWSFRSRHWQVGPSFCLKRRGRWCVNNGENFREGPSLISSPPMARLRPWRPPGSPRPQCPLPLGSPPPLVRSIQFTSPRVTPASKRPAASSSSTPARPPPPLPQTSR
jgi:hypothetical protein